MNKNIHGHEGGSGSKSDLPGFLHGELAVLTFLTPVLSAGFGSYQERALRKKGLA